MGLMYDLFFENSTSDNSSDSSDMEVSEEVETPEDTTEETPDVSIEETPEESIGETPEDTTEETPEESIEETPEESTGVTHQEIIVSVNGIDIPTFTIHLSVCIFLLACLLGVCLCLLWRFCLFPAHRICTL